jgi:hypothetical protein
MPNLVSLVTLRTRARQRCGQDYTSGTGIATDAEINTHIQASWQELYELILERYQEQYAKNVSFNITSGTDTYTWATIGCSDFYKCLGVDYYNGGGFYTTLRRFNFADRNSTTPSAPMLVGYPGLYEMKYQVRADAIVFMQPIVAGTIRLWYAPVAPTLTADGDTIDDVNGFGEYVVVDTAIKLMTKEESDISGLMAQKAALRDRIIASAATRDIGGPITVSDTSRYGWERW